MFLNAFDAHYGDTIFLEKKNMTLYMTTTKQTFSMHILCVLTQIHAHCCDTII